MHVNYYKSLQSVALTLQLSVHKASETLDG